MRKFFLVTIFFLSGFNLSGCINYQSLLGSDNKSLSPIENNSQKLPQSSPNPSVETQTSNQYIEYSPIAIEQATNNGGKAVLFFHANWCPTCQAADRDITSKLGQIPQDVTIIKTDYDSYPDLKKKYGITYQHTFVQVDSQGVALKKWNGGGLAEIVDQLES